MKKSIILTFLLAGGFIHSYAAIAVDDVILINFTKTNNTVGGNWNEFEGDGGSNISGPTTFFSDLIRLSDGATTGVSLDNEITSIWGGIGGADFTANSNFAFPESGTIPDEAQENLTYHNGPDVMFIFENLDDSLTYDLSILSANPNDRDAANWVAQAGPNQTSLSVDPNPGGVFTFSGLSTDGNGKITLSNSTDSGQHINAMELVAIPEPGTLVLAGLAMAAAFLGLKRRR